MGFFCSPPGRVNLASKSRSGAPLESLSDLLKGLAPCLRNANQPTGPNLTSPIPPNPRQGTLKIDNYARGSLHCSLSLAIYNPLAFWGEPDTSHHSEVLSARPVALASGTPPHGAAPASTPKGVPSPGSQWPCPIISGTECHVQQGLTFPGQLLGKTPGLPLGVARLLRPLTPAHR